LNPHLDAEKLHRHRLPATTWQAVLFLYGVSASPPAKPTVFLVDGYALIYRAFYANDLEAAHHQAAAKTRPPPGVWSIFSAD